MKTHFQKYIQQLIYTALTAVSLFGLMLSVACSTTTVDESKSSLENTATRAEIETQPAEAATLSPSPTATEILPTPTLEPVTLADIAEEVAEDVGEVTTVVETDSEAVIFVFEERHDSVLGQVEIAMMLHHLYTNHDVRHIGLEGLPANEGPLDLTWAHREPYYQPDQIITGREDVLVQMLQDGEFSSAELMGLIYHDVVVDGIDDAELYAFDPPEEAWDAPDFYLYYIALAGMSDPEITAWTAVYENEQFDEAFEFAVSTDEFTAQMWERLSDPVNIISAEEWRDVLDELSTQAASAGADLTDEDAANLAAMDEYFEHVSQRSEVMVANILALASAFPQAPAAMTIGALHTQRVVELLTESGVSFVVIRPQALAEGSTAGMLSPEAYRRKQQGLSVAPDGFLGALLDGRDKKPPPVGDTERIEFEEALRRELQMIAWRTFHGLGVPTGVPLPGGAQLVTHNSIGVSGDPDNPPIIEWEVLGPGGLTGDLYGSTRITLRRGTVRLLPGSVEKLEVTIWGRLTQTRGYLQQQATPPPETEAGTQARPQQICSNTEVTLTETGG